TNGMCMALLAAGATCTADNQCAYGTACIGGTGARTCAAAPKLGDACVQRGGTTATACIVDGLVWDATTHCVAPLGPGQACSPNTQPTCKNDLQCDPTALTCGALP